MVNQAPVLCVPDCLCKNALGGEVKQEATPCPLQPVHKGLAGLVLVVLQSVVAPPVMQRDFLLCLAKLRNG